MSDEEDDYLSPKFLLEAESSSSGSKSYSELRKEARRVAEVRDAANREKQKKYSAKTRVQEGLSTSLFERVREEEKMGLGTSKALNMMMKMGFKEGESLGRKAEVVASSVDFETGHPNAEVEGDESTEEDAGENRHGIGGTTGDSVGQHRVEPLPISAWAGECVHDSDSCLLVRSYHSLINFFM